MDPIFTNVQTMEEVRQALRLIVLQLNKLSSTETNEGASMISIADAGGKYTSTTVEGALQELNVP